jgi:hypothetical protein
LLKWSSNLKECKPLLRGSGDGGSGGAAGMVRAAELAERTTQFNTAPPGRAVQVDPIKLTLKPPETKRLKL